MQDKCYTHKKTGSEAKCALCAKAYCKDCLTLTSELQIVICENCYSIQERKFKKGITRRKVYLALGGVIILLGLFAWYATGELDDTTLFALALIVALSIVNIIRIKQMKAFLIRKKYNS